MIRINNLCKQFGPQQVLDDVNMHLAINQIHGLIGRNGSGKTVLLKCICGLMKPTSGTIHVADKQLGKDIEMPDDFGALIENPGFLPNYSGYKNLLFLAKIKKKCSPVEIRESMKLVGLSDVGSKHVQKYSRGMKQRLGIAQAIMENPKLLILDEPFNGLDNAGCQEIRALLEKLRDEGKTLLIVSHNPLDIDALCDTVHEIDSGKLRRIR